jgi:hypothetical protein
MTTIDEKGEFTRDALFINKEIEMITCTTLCKKLSKNKVSLYAQKIGIFVSSKDMLGSLEVK